MSAGTTSRPSPGDSGDPLMDSTEIGTLKKKAAEEELQRPAFLRLRPGRLRT